MRPLTVLNIAYPLAPVSPDCVGGAEQVLSALDAALTAAGHRSVVIACEGSRVAGELVAIPAPPAHGLISDGISLARQDAVRQAAAHVLRRKHEHPHAADVEQLRP